MSTLAEQTKLQNGRYTLGRVLGRGGFGVTYFATDNDLKTEVAIKEYFPAKLCTRDGMNVLPQSGSESEFKEGYARFETEWKILASLTNIKSIVRGLGFFKENRTSYIVMELLDGQDVKAMIRDVPPEETLPLCEYIIKSIGSALIEVHNRGIIHLDVSPGNIFFQSDGSLRLFDFGSAIYINGEDQDTVQLKHGFAPPELYSVKSPKGPWTDVYALGATYYNLVTGKKVPPATERLENDGLVPLDRLRTDIPKHIADSVHRALLLSTKSRYRTVLEFLDGFSGKQDFRADSPAYNRGAPIHNPAHPGRNLNTENEMKRPEKAAEFIGKIGKALTSITPKIQFPESEKNPVTGYANYRDTSFQTPMIKANSIRYGQINIKLQPGTVYRIGRAAGREHSDFVVSDDLRISKAHLRVRFDPVSRDFYVTDISANGTFFPDRRRLEKNIEYRIAAGGTVFLASEECSITFTIT